MTFLTITTRTWFAFITKISWSTHATTKWSVIDVALGRTTILTWIFWNEFQSIVNDETRYCKIKYQHQKELEDEQYRGTRWRTSTRTTAAMTRWAQHTRRTDEQYEQKQRRSNNNKNLETRRTRTRTWERVQEEQDQEHTQRHRGKEQEQKRLTWWTWTRKFNKLKPKKQLKQSNRPMNAFKATNWHKI